MMAISNPSELWFLTLALLSNVATRNAPPHSDAIPALPFSFKWMLFDCVKNLTRFPKFACTLLGNLALASARNSAAIHWTKCSVNTTTRMS